ncbi:MAG: hypothetical protein LBK05_00185 [Treponema sp.]|jgi:hypothetical protein|nr:hypothetical protein [Treponema sp.]
MDNMKDFFYEESAEPGFGSEEMLIKALSAGYGTDAAQFTGGRALQPEDCETTLVNVMREDQSDFKLMNTLKKTPVKSTVHQANLRLDIGDEDSGFVSEGGIAPDNNQDIRRITRDMKYIQKRGEVTEQAVVADTFEPAFEAEKIACTLSTLRTAEKYCFHGDSAVVPKQFDGLIAQIKAAPAVKRNIYDMRGRSIQAEGESIFTRMAENIADQGGAANKVFYPLILGDDIQALCRDRLRFGIEDDRMAAVFKTYPTLYGSLSIADDAGPDKMFKPKGVVKPGGIIGHAGGIPNKPVSAALSAAASGQSQFLAADAGNYTYLVHAINEYGISEGVSPAAPVAVAAGDAVAITITPAATNPGTGFIICRSVKGGTSVMEMVRIGKDEQNTTTVYSDLNDNLPGTAEMLFITEKKMQTVVEFLQFLPLRLYRMYPTDRLVTPFIMALWGSPSMKAPHWCGVVKNIAYRGGLYA